MIKKKINLANKKMDAKNIEFIKNLVEYDYDGLYYDLHNNFDCQKILFQNGNLSLVFKEITTALQLTLIFEKVSITSVDFFNVNNIECLTIDTLYRGRIVENDLIIEVFEDKAYFYLEFYEGQKIEFWANALRIER